MLYFEDLTPGRRFSTGSVTVSEADIIGFAQQYDPQPFHTDPEAARHTFFDGLAASGWHTSSLTMRLVVESELSTVANGLIGMGIDKMRWPRPTRPGDTLTAELTVLDQRRSGSRPDFGVVRFSWTTVNQHGETVMALETSIWAACRPA